MEVNQLPTKPGPYYWRESDGDEWEIHTVFIDDELNNTLMALCPIDDTWYATKNWGGQWLPIPPADELVKLQAKAKMVDEGHESWGVYHPSGQLVLTGDKSDREQQVDYMNDTDIFAAHQKHTCEPVTIVRNQKQK